MTEARKRSLYATALLVGSTLGAGVFGLPYAFAQSGWLIGAFTLVFVGALLLVLQLINTELCLQTPGRHRIVGLVGRYLGTRWRWVATILFFGLGWGILLAYAILGGAFLFELLAPVFGGNVSTYSLIFVVIEAILVLAPIKRAASIELIIGSLLLILFVVLILSGVPFIEWHQVVAVDVTHTLAPYGVVIFALASLGVAPEIHDIFGEKYEYRMPKAIVHGFLILLLLYLAFTFVIVGVNGIETSENALSAYVPILGSLAFLVGSVVGLITIGSISLMVGEQVKDTLRIDLGASKVMAWSLTWAIPVALFLFGVRDFINVISFTGAVFTALLAVCILLTYERMRGTICCRRHCFVVPRWMTIFIGVLFVSGAIRQIFLTMFL